MAKSTKKKPQVEPPPPPKLPETLPELDRAIMLLGSRQTQELSAKPRAELVQLIGEYPSREVATYWKKWLKGARQEFAA